MKGTETSKGNYLQRENMKGTVFTGTQKRRELYLQGHTKKEGNCIYRDTKKKGTVFTERKRDGICTDAEQ